MQIRLNPKAELRVGQRTRLRGSQIWRLKRESDTHQSISDSALCVFHISVNSVTFLQWRTLTNSLWKCYLFCRNFIFHIFQRKGLQLSLHASSSSSLCVMIWGYSANYRSCQNRSAISSQVNCHISSWIITWYHQREFSQWKMFVIFCPFQFTNMRMGNILNFFIMKTAF